MMNHYYRLNYPLVYKALAAAPAYKGRRKSFPGRYMLYICVDRPGKINDSHPACGTLRNLNVIGRCDKNKEHF